MDQFFSGKLDIETFLLSKRLELLSGDNVNILKRIQDYSGVEEFNEAEVRSYVIDPILRVLGYDKGTPFSTSLENHLLFLGQKRRSDYQIHLWKENFWLLEAKRPQVGAASFDYEDFSQALEYSVHPTVNAALIVLCDGLKLEIFDREVSVENPVLHIEIKNLVDEFDKVRVILEPMQVWFFQKRRIMRLLDRVFDKEFVMSRVDEFSDLLQRRLSGKRNIVIDNFRRMIKPDSEEQREMAATASLSELTELYMMFDLPAPIDHTVNMRLVELSVPSSFNVMYKIFPDSPRPVNDCFMSQSAAYLVALAEKRDTVEWLPAWLAHGKQSGAELEVSIKYLLDQCLTYFQDYEPYRLVLLAASSIWRIAKLNTITNDGNQRLGTELHAIARFTLPEVSWAQVVASPAGQLTNIIDTQASAALSSFVSRNKAENGSFRTESAKLQLKSYWELEKKILSGIPNYKALLAERSLGEMRMIEWSSVTYDNLGHSMIARLHRFPKWKSYLMAERRELVEQVASTGSWAAREWLGIAREDKYEAMADEQLADRFFLGDADTLRAIRQWYRGHKS
ncbi:MAG: type I restriction enzyme HsdR N-terminal domain-containing protein [bacterium]|nr:type I restriction enzyme HsdR N-terminal domain-containing protein [bacterium]